MKKQFKWLALTSGLFLSSYLAPQVLAEELAKQVPVLEAQTTSLVDQTTQSHTATIAAILQEDTIELHLTDISQVEQVQSVQVMVADANGRQQYVDTTVEEGRYDISIPVPTATEGTFNYVAEVTITYQDGKKVILPEYVFHLQKPTQSTTSPEQSATESPKGTNGDTGQTDGNTSKEQTKEVPTDTITEDGTKEQSVDQSPAVNPSETQEEAGAIQFRQVQSAQNTTPQITVTNKNAQTGSFDVIVSNLSSANGVEKVLLPIWSTAGGQDDLIWYVGTKQADNTYKISVSNSHHENSTGEYAIHLYYTDKSNATKFVSATTTTVTRSSTQRTGTMTVVPQNATTGDFDILISNIYDPNGFRIVHVPVWSEVGGQDDLVWYVADRLTDGTYKVSVKVANHKGATGKYTAQLYYTDVNERSIGVTGQTINVAPSKPQGKLTVTKSQAADGSFDVIVSDVQNAAGVQAVYIPVWGAVNGQNDLVWHTATRQTDGTYKVTVKPSEHKYEAGTYHVNLYYAQNDGSVIGVTSANGQVTFAEPTGRITVANQNATTGDFDLVVSNVSDPRGVKEVLVPVWATVNGQNDLVWHTATRQNDGTYKATIKTGDHKYETGAYNAHLYYRRNDGSLAYVAATNTQVTLGKSNAKITVTNVNHATGSFDVVVSDIVAPTGLKTVNIPVWSDAGGQDDIVWYAATRQNDGTYKTTVIAASHKYTNGRYQAHLYFTDGLDKLVSIPATTAITLNLPEYTGVTTISPVTQSNWSFDVTVSHVGAKTGVKEVQVAIWSDHNGQDDLKWYTASKQADGTYKVVVRLANYHYTNGGYQAHVYYKMNDQSHKGINGKTTTVSVKPPRAHIQQELAALHGQFNQLFAGVGGQKSLYITPADGTETLLINNGTQRSASTIKLFILAAFYAKVARGEINPNQMHTVNPSEIVAASVNLTNTGGQSFSLAQLAHFMVSTSDNTATNIIMRYIGGVDAVNAEIRRLGYTQTRMERFMHDPVAINAGKENYISAQEAGDLLKNIYNKALINQQLDSQMLVNLSNNYYPLWLTADIKHLATVYDKPGNHTGNGVENDIAVIAKNNRAYIVSILTQGAWNQTMAIRGLGSAVYRELIN